MASIVTGILSKTVDLLLNKARDKTAEKLKDGHITDGKLRELIVRELNDVKTKLAGLSRKDLLTSYNFLLEGVNLLKTCLDKSDENQKAVANETHDDGGETSTKPSGSETGILAEVLKLSKAMGKVKINSDEDLIECAKKRFKDARKKATEAFCIETLSIEDRIFAAKLRIVSELLESLERPDTAIINCLPFLETLHSLPAIREIFSVYINRGYKSKFNKAERVENVKSVMLINYVLFQFVSQFTSKNFTAITWPTIELGDRSFHPILSWTEVSRRKSWGEEFIQPPNEVILNEELAPFISAVNSHGEIIACGLAGNINVISRTGEVKIVKLNYPGDGDVTERNITGLAFDIDDKVYVVTHLETRTESGVVKSYVLYIFDENYNVKQNCTLQFLDVTRMSYVDIAINKNNTMHICMILDPHVYVCDNAGQLKHKFKLERIARLQTISDKNEILLAQVDGKAIHKYTEKGDLESTIEVPARHEVYGVAFHHVISKIAVLTFNWESHSCFLLCYSETGELESSTFVCNTEPYQCPPVRSHPSGPAAVIWRKSITFI